MHTHTHIPGYDIFCPFNREIYFVTCCLQTTVTLYSSNLRRGRRGLPPLPQGLLYGQGPWLLSARAQESAFICTSKRTDLQKWVLQQTRHVHTAEYVPVEGNHYSYRKTYKNDKLSLAQSPVSFSLCEAIWFLTSVSENQMWEYFNCIGEVKWKKSPDTLMPDWWSGLAHILLDNHSKGKLSLWLGFDTVFHRHCWYLDSGLCLIYVQYLLQVCTPEQYSL